MNEKPERVERSALRNSGAMASPQNWRSSGPRSEIKIYRNLFISHFTTKVSEIAREGSRLARPITTSQREQRAQRDPT